MSIKPDHVLFATIAIYALGIPFLAMLTTALLWRHSLKRALR